MERDSDSDMSAFFSDFLSCATNSAQNNSLLSEEKKSKWSKAFDYKRGLIILILLYIHTHSLLVMLFPFSLSTLF